MNEIIEVKQLPIIVEQLQTIKADVTARVNDALSLDCTENTVKAVKNARSDLSYDDNGNRLRTVYPDGTSVSTEYDSRGRITRQTDQNGYSTRYTLDASDNLTRVTNAQGVSTSYAGLHAEVRQYLESHGMTMAEFVAQALQDELHPKINMREENTMGNMRTLAFQVPEELFQQIKDYLQRNNMTQKEFVIGLIKT